MRRYPLHCVRITAGISRIRARTFTVMAENGGCRILPPERHPIYHPVPRELSGSPRSSPCLEGYASPSVVSRHFTAGVRLHLRNGEESSLRGG